MTDQAQPNMQEGAPDAAVLGAARAAIIACGGRVTRTSPDHVLSFEISRYPTGWSKGALPRIEGALDLSPNSGGASVRYRYGWLIQTIWLWGPALMLIAGLVNPHAGLGLALIFTGLTLAFLAAYLWIAPLKSPRMVLDDLQEHLQGETPLGQALAGSAAAGHKEAGFPYGVRVPGDEAEAYAFAVEAIAHNGWRKIEGRPPKSAHFMFQSMGSGAWTILCSRRTLDLRIEPHDEGGYEARLRWTFHAAWWAVFPILLVSISAIVVFMRAAAHRPETGWDALGLIVFPIGFTATLLMFLGNRPEKPPEYVRRDVLRRLSAE